MFDPGRTMLPIFLEPKAYFLSICNRSCSKILHIVSLPALSLHKSTNAYFTAAGGRRGRSKVKSQATEASLLCKSEIPLHLSLVPIPLEPRMDLHLNCLPTSTSVRGGGAGYKRHNTQALQYSEARVGVMR